MLISCPGKEDITQPWRTPELTAKLELEFCTQQYTRLGKIQKQKEKLIREGKWPPKPETPATQPAEQQ